MTVRSLSLRHFRNYERLDVSFADGLNVLCGENAQGKTNILEAIFLCSAGRSHRTARDAEMVMHGERSARVCARIFHPLRGDMEIDIDIERGGGKSIKLNGVPLRRMGELLGHLPAVIFSPEDLGIVKDEPQVRRRFLDIFISQAKPAYFFDLHQYNKALRQRNALLRQLRAEQGAAGGRGGAMGGCQAVDMAANQAIYKAGYEEIGAAGDPAEDPARDPAEDPVRNPAIYKPGDAVSVAGGVAVGCAASALPAWDATLARLGARVMGDRRVFLERIGARAHENHAAVCEGSESFRLIYAPSVKIARDDGREDIERKLLEALARGADADIARMSTQAGPHKDDMSATLDGKSLKLYGSQGQQRTASLALKLAQVDVMAEEVGDLPVLLLDDVMSELDVSRQKNIAERIRATQTFLTDTDARSIRGAQAAAAAFIVRGGRVERDE